MMTPTPAFAAVLAIASVLAGCAAPCLFDETGRVSIAAAPDANRNAAFAVDLVAANDAALADRLAGLDAAAWFTQRAQLQRDNPATLTVEGWELAPGQSVGPQEVRFPCGPDALFVFASLRAPGAHRVRLDGLRQVQVDIGAEEMRVTP